MSNQNLIDIEVGVLILKYGYEKVIKAISRVQNVTPEEIEKLLAEAQQKKGSKSKARKPSAHDLASRIAQDRPEIASVIQQLAAKFESKVFLPQMMEIRRFLEKNGVNTKSVKSRMEATKKVFEILSCMSAEELRELSEFTRSGESDLSVLADQIIGRKAK